MYLSRKKPLNGEKTHPLTPHARMALHDIGQSMTGIPKQEFNAGVVDRLMREDLVEITQQRSPYKTHGGKLISFLVITKAGIWALAKS